MPGPLGLLEAQLNLPDYQLLAVTIPVIIVNLELPLAERFPGAACPPTVADPEPDTGTVTILTCRPIRW